MKKKTLATASLLLALLMPLGATPLAVYADEGEGVTQSETSNGSGAPEVTGKTNTAPEGTGSTSEGSEGTGSTNKAPEGTGETNTAPEVTGKTNKAPEGTGNKDEKSEGEDNGNTNGGSEEDAPESEEKVAATNGVTPPPADMLYGHIWNSRDSSLYASLEEATKNAQSGDTLYLGEGNYTLYKVDSTGTTKGKDLTFVGSGVGLTAWNIGALVPDPANFGTEYNGDYSFDGAGTVTFENMTLRSGTADYLGFIRANNTVVDNCTINGKTFYWGYKSAKFTNTTFNAPTNGFVGDYALWTYSSPVMTFDSCTFNGKGKIINVYTDYGAGKNNIIVNFNNCTVNSTFPIKSALNINDSNMDKYKYILNITKANVTAARDNKFTCSQVFGFGEDDAKNTGRTDVNLDGKLVFSDGKKLTHSYTDGEHDQAYTFTYTGDWSGWKPTEGDEHLLYRTRPRTKTCNYCGYTETAPEEREEKREYLLHYDLNGGTGAEGVYSDRYYFAPTGGNTATVAAAPSRAGYQSVGRMQTASGTLRAML